ncbi:MAG TPA: glycosyltransferase family 2 protein [Burkholderiales bacterium]|nr:glycosyltransferase family 2 protein [Burkholderiales bacterium]
MTSQNHKLPLSVVIISHNAAGIIEPCLRSVAFADEIVVVDSGSMDGTIDIAQRCGARVIQHDWCGFGPQKQFAVSQARHDWVLCLDTDERVSAELQESIRVALEKPMRKAYSMPRCNRFMGRWLKHGEGYPDESLRLFDRRHARWSDDLVHEKIVTVEIVERLAGDLMHESAEDIATYLNKQNRYTTTQAEILFGRGKRVSFFRIALSPMARFIKFYIFKLGFLDGVPGLVHIAIGCFNSFIKYAKLRELQRQQETA